MPGGELFTDEVPDSLSNVLGGQAKMLHQFPGMARNAEAIGDAHHIELQGLAEIFALPQNCAGNDIPEAPDLVFFRGSTTRVSSAACTRVATSGGFTV